MNDGLAYFLVDAFADRPFAGNPAAVVLLPAWKEDGWLQNVAAEMNQAETAFLVKNTDGYALRWLTPTVEVDLCGHATLASAHILWREGMAAPETVIHFSTRSGVLKAASQGSAVELDFPLAPAEPIAAPPGLLEALGAAAEYVGKNRFDYLVEVESESILRGLKPDFKRLGALDARGVIVTSQSFDPRFSFVSRFFAPAVGIDEDPATGSSHCCLGDHWRKRTGKSKFTAFQASKRGGVVQVEVVGDRVLLGGGCVVTAEGKLLVG